MNVQMGNERIEKGGMTLVAYVESKRSRFEPTILRQSIRKVLLFLFSIRINQLCYVYFNLYVSNKL